MLRRRVLPVSGILVIALLLAACPANSYDKAGLLAKDFAASVLVLQETEIQVHRAGFIDDALHKNIQTELMQVADAGTALDKAINQAHSVSSATAQVTVIRQLLSDLSTNKLAGVKNENSQLAVKAALLTAQTIIDQIAAFGGK